MSSRYLSVESTSQERYEQIEELITFYSNERSIKREILSRMFEYAKTNMVDIKTLGISTVSPERFITFNNILYASTFFTDDLQFVQYVINEIGTIKHSYSKMRNSIMPIACQYRDILTYPQVEKIYKISLWLSFILLFVSLLNKSNIYIFIVIPILLSFFAKEIIYTGIDLAVKKQFYEEFTNKYNVVGDNQHDFINNFINEISPVFESKHKKVLGILNKWLL